MYGPVAAVIGLARQAGVAAVAFFVGAINGNLDVMVTHTHANSERARVAQPREPAQPLVPGGKRKTSAVVPAEELTPEQKVMVRLNRKATIIRDLAFPAAMSAAVPVAKSIGTAAHKAYQDWFVRMAGNPSDPVEIVLLQQITLAHHRVALLHAQAEQTKSYEATKIYSTAATRLTGEVRRLALALKQYREPSGKKQFVVVRQQNVSAGGQQVAYVDQSGKPQEQIPFFDDGSEQGRRSLEYAPQVPCIPQSQPQAASGRATEPETTGPLDRGGPNAVAARRPCEQAVVEIDGAQNRGRQAPLRRKRSLASKR